MTILDDIDSGKYFFNEKIPGLPHKPGFTPTTKEEREVYDKQFSKFEEEYCKFNSDLKRAIKCKSEILERLFVNLVEEFSLDEKTARSMFNKACRIEHITRNEGSTTTNIRKIYEIFEVLVR